MRRALTILVCLGISLIGYKATVGPLLGQVLSSDSQPTQEIPTVAGMSYEKAQEIVGRHEKDLLKVPGVRGADAGKDGIVIEVTVYTNEKGEKPSTLPAELQQLPTVIESLPVRIFPIYVFPPPPGVLILRPGGKRERAEACPPGYGETSLHGWRFCFDPGNPEPLPGVMMLPIAGISREEAFKILDRHRDELRALPGVGSVGMGENGIYIETTDPSVLPKDVEGLPLDVHPPQPGEKRQSTHGLTTTYRPVRGGIPFGVPGQAPAGTLGPIAFECGFWLIFPAHSLSSTQCNTTSACVFNQLSECFARYATSNPPVNQPFYPYVQTDQRIGQIVKWTANAPNTSVYDVAAAWLDDDVNQGNSSLCASRSIEQIGEWSGLDVDQNTLTHDQALRVYTMNSPHTKRARVEYVDMAESGIQTSCGGGGFVTHLGQVAFTSTDQNFAPGDSGAPVLTLDGRFVAMFQWTRTRNGIPIAGGGVMGKYIKSQLGFSKWYGTATFPNHPQVCQ